ncbi:MAG: adenylate/guanylate cyclase domain-containing protein [Cyclobacteriaceae bacterium]
MRIEELEECIDLEIVKTEKRRLSIFLGVLIFALILLVVNMVFFPVTISEVFLDPRSMQLGVYVSMGMIILLFVSRIMVGKIATCEKPLPMGYKFYSVFIESVIPIIWLCFIVAWEKNAIFLDSPLIFIYIPMLIVSSLHLSFWLSFFNGLLIAVMYAGLSFWAFENFGDGMFLPSIVYYSKALLFLIAGICGGFVARELKKRLTISIQTQEERDAIETLFSQQVSKQVVSALKSRRDYSIKAEVTVMFLDIRNFTNRVQHMSPEEVNKFQNKFFGPIIDCIDHCGGIINQLMGDGLMASFGSAEGELHHERAYRSATDIFASLEMSNKGMDEPIKIGVGIHSGEVIAGNIGTETRQQFSISGIPVITAARLEQMTKEYDSEFLVSKDFFEKIKHLANNGSSLGSIKMRGLDRELEIIKLK